MTSCFGKRLCAHHQCTCQCTVSPVIHGHVPACARVRHAHSITTVAIQGLGYALCQIGIHVYGHTHGRDTQTDPRIQRMWVLTCALPKTTIVVQNKRFTDRLPLLRCTGMMWRPQVELKTHDNMWIIRYPKAAHEIRALAQGMAHR